MLIMMMIMMMRVKKSLMDLQAPAASPRSKTEKERAILEIEGLYGVDIGSIWGL